MPRQARACRSWRTLGVAPMNQVTGSAAVTLAPVTVLPAGPSHTYLGVATNFVPAIRMLAQASPSPALPLAMLCAHTLECILKAYLSRDGDDRAVKTPDVRHNLTALWSLAGAQGLDLPTVPPEWVLCLSGLHASPYYLRYSTGVHGIVSPAAEPMASELAALLEHVRGKLWSTGRNAAQAFHRADAFRQASLASSRRSWQTLARANARPRRSP